MKVKIRIIIAALIAISNQTTAQPLPSYVPSNGLVGWWPFNGNANDESGNGNHGTVNGATLTADRNGNTNSAYSFDGIPARIDIGSIQNSEIILGAPNTSWSVSAWVNKNNYNGTLAFSDYNSVAGNTNPGENDITFATHLSVEGGLAYVSMRSNAVEFGTQGGSITNNQWHHISFTASNGALNLYVDGSLVSSVMYNSSLNYFENPFYRIGAGMWNGNYGPSHGLVDDIAIYNRALSQEEITVLYTGTTSVSGCTNATACNYNASATLDDGSCTFPAQTYLNCDGTCINDTDADGVCNELETPALPAYLPINGLVGYWPFNGNANDESGNGNHGTVNGATLTADRNGNAYSAYFFNNNSYIRIFNSNSLNNISNITLNCFANASSIAGNEDYIISRWESNANRILGFRFNGNGSQYEHLWAEAKINNQYQTCSSNGSELSNQLENNVFYMLTLTIDNSNMNLYKNGILIKSCGLTGGLTYTASDIIVGWDNYGAFFHGVIDDIAIYNRALTASEITALYTGSSSNNGGGGGGAVGTPAASVPAGIPYQAVIRDNAGTALVNTPVSVRFTLQQNTTDGTVEYQETQSLTTNAMGLINTQIGTGTATQGTFASINWSNTTKFIQVEANTGAGYVDMGTQQLMSVPFAFQANKATAIKNAGLPVYADNAAALAGGLVAGEMYRTAAGVLMVVY